VEIDDFYKIYQFEIEKSIRLEKKELNHVRGKDNCPNIEILNTALCLKISWLWVGNSTRAEKCGGKLYLIAGQGTAQRWDDFALL